MNSEQDLLGFGDKTIHVLVGSDNPVKIGAVKDAIALFHPIAEVVGVEVDPKVPQQPIGEETIKGAQTRAAAARKHAIQKKLEVDLFVGIEGGIVEHTGQWFTFACMCVMDCTGRTGYGQSPQLPLPDEISRRLIAGEELGLVMDEVSGVEGTKFLGGSTEFFTKGIMDRREYYRHGMIMAMVPFLNVDMYFRK